MKNHFDPSWRLPYRELGLTNQNSNASLQLLIENPFDKCRYNNYIVSMKRRLKVEIKQRRPFTSSQEEAFLNLQRTADALMRGFEELLKPSGLTHTQYNVLRILRGAAPEGLPCRELAERMITRDPDVTRLLDRLEARGLVSRTRDVADRRIIVTRITAQGMRLLEGLDSPVAELHRRQLSHLGGDRIQKLIDLLEVTRKGSR
jgi:DNA-binding MarR family transcriptional regulator